MPTTAPFTKVNNCRKFGANVILHGQHIGEAKDHAIDTYPNMKYINGYDDKEIIAGAGTVAMEILEQVCIYRCMYLCDMCICICVIMGIVCDVCYMCV